MRSVRARHIALPFLALALVACTEHGDSAKVATGYSDVVDGVQIYLGVIPSAMVRGHPGNHAESSMHGGARSVSGEHHVVISMFDAKTGARLENLEIRAKVGELGMSAVQKHLEPMNIAGSITYGNYFLMSRPGPYSIELDWHRTGEQKWSHATFSYRHGSN